MQITLSVNNPEVEEPELRLVTLGVYPEMTIETLRSSIEAEGIPAPAQHLYHNGQLITDNTKTLQELQITDGDMLALHVRDMRGSSGVDPSQRDQAPRRRPAAAPAGGAPLPQDPELIRLQVLGDPALRAQLQRLNPALAAVIEDPQRFAQLFQNSALEQEQAREEPPLAPALVLSLGLLQLTQLPLVPLHLHPQPLRPPARGQQYRRRRHRLRLQFPLIEHSQRVISTNCSHLVLIDRQPSMLCKRLMATSNMLLVCSSSLSERIEAAYKPLALKTRTGNRHEPRKRDRICIGNGSRHSLTVNIEGALVFGRKYCCTSLAPD
ncbi:hypothetical protein F4825DRAFT_82763 [Nemania diffusa]|nr:hypothetical protein F4825DRAFT_82763 [Nemania diffusa]